MDSDDSKLEKLINQCKSNDIDVKVDALTKLQTEFDSGIEINDPDGLINVLKTCLRTSNQHLTTATLAALPPLLPILISRSANYPSPRNGTPQSASSSTSSVAPPAAVDAATLRQVLGAFLPAGGVFERLGDRERAQIKARETLVILGGLAFRAGGGSTFSTRSRDGKGPETPIMIFERFMREGGLASKVWKVREQSILTLVHIRRSHHQFPIRPYLNLLVDCLEDTDAHVRDCARQSVVELFSGPGVTDGARADLKKEMTKKGVRKTIVDGVLSKLLAGSVASNPQSREGSENGDAVNLKPKEYVPPSSAIQNNRPTGGSNPGVITRSVSHGNVKEVTRPRSRTATVPSPTPATSETIEIQPVYIASSRDLENDFAAMLKPFEGKETEHNWAAREQAILRVRGMLKGDVHLRYSDAFLASLKEGFMQWSTKALASLRTTVAVHTISLYSELAIALGPALDPFCENMLLNLLRMAGFTKKITAQQSQVAVSVIINHTSAQPRTVIPLLWNTLQEKTVQARAFVVGHLKTYLEVHGQRSKHPIESSGGLENLEKSVKKALSDVNPAVRETARVLFWVFERVWQDHGMAILETLDPLARKQVERVCPDPDLVAVLPPSTPKATKKTSVAATIAASRAKARAIATAPPTLRHQATSASYVPSSRRPGSPNTSPRSPTLRPASPLRMSTSPPSTHRPRVVSTGGVTRSVSTTAVPSLHTRTPSGGSGRAVSPPSPSEQSHFRRRTSSPLATTGSSPSKSSVIRKAVQTALPVSPPSSTGQVSPPPRNINESARYNSAPLPARQSTLFETPNGDDESLLLAQTVPIPAEDSDSDGDNLMSFSTPYKMYPPAIPKTDSQVLSFSLKSNDSKPIARMSNALSSGSVADISGDQPIVEDAMKARAEQAESAAERLLELVEPEEDVQNSTIPASLLVGSSNGHTTQKAKNKPAPIPIVLQALPATPLNRSTVIMRQAAMFRDSPAHNGRSSPSLMDVLQGRKHETGWWLKRKDLVARGTPLKAVDPSNRAQELRGYITMLEQGEPGIQVLQKLALLCAENPVAESTSPPASPGYGLPNSPSPWVSSSRSLPSFHTDIWDKDKNFERLFKALMQFLDPSKSEEELEYGLILLWEIFENQAPYLEGKEADLFSALLRVRYSNKLSVLEATNTIRDALTVQIEPVYGLTTIHASLRAFHGEVHPASSDEDTKAAAYAFGLIALGKFILRLPAEIAEEELPRLKGTLISSLNDKSSLIVRESAAASIIAAQLVLRDEAHLFALLDGLADEKKNLLTYLFDKHSARELSASVYHLGVEKLEKEIGRLDTRTSTPSRPSLATPISTPST